jgi:parallel beta-helix repeat protein
MSGKAVSGIMLTLLLIGMLTLASNIQPVRASGTIYIRPDGSVEGSDKIQRDGDLYAFTDNIYDEIVVEIDNIVVDGAGYTLQGTGARDSKGIDLTERRNVTIKNMEIKGFFYGISLFYYCSSNVLSGNYFEGNTYGIYLYKYCSSNVLSGNYFEWNGIGISLFYYCSSNVLSGNTASRNNYGIYLWDSSGILSGNTASGNYWGGIYLEGSSGDLSGNTANNNFYGIALKDSHFADLSGNTVSGNDYGIYLHIAGMNVLSGNNVSSNGIGIYLYVSCSNIISGNTVSGNGYGIRTEYTDNSYLFHNNLINNVVQANIYTHGYDNWDSGYPSGGNYWSDYTGVDEFSGPNQDEPGADGITDKPYTLDAYNQDNYPLMKPYRGAHDIGITGITPSETSVEPGSMLDINVTVLNYGFYTETFSLTAYANTTVISQTEVTLSSRNSATITFTWDTTGVTFGTYIISAYVTPVPNEIDRADNYFKDGVVTVATPEYLAQKLIETIKTWNLPRGTENSFTSKLQEAILLLNKRHDNGAIHKLMDFINGVEALREKGKLEDWQTDYLVSEAQRIIDLIQG